MKVIKKLNEKNAVALMAVLLFLVLVMLFQAAILIYINSQTRMVERRNVYEASLYGAESGIEWAKYKVAEWEFDGHWSRMENVVFHEDLGEGGSVSFVIESVEYKEENSTDYEDICGFNPYEDGECSNFWQHYWVNVGSSQDYTGVIREEFEIRGSLGAATKAGLYDESRKINATLVRERDAKITMQRKRDNFGNNPDIFCVKEIRLERRDPFIRIIEWREIIVE